MVGDDIAASPLFAVVKRLLYSIFTAHSLSIVMNDKKDLLPT